jgi:UbiA prenyltransferase family protein
VSPVEQNTNGGTALAWLQLIRLPNLFTAAADVAAGFLFTHAAFSSGDALPMSLLIAASVLLYAGGVVLNDVFDYGLDCKERPERPLPSGRISLGAGKLAGWGLLVAGVGLAGVAAVLGGDIRPGVVAVGLAVTIVAYDGLLKKTPLGPPAMGACRGLNLLLGMSLSTAAWASPHFLIGGAMTVYVMGITWFARTEAEQSRRGQLLLSAVVILTGILLLEPLPRWTDDTVVRLQLQPSRWTLLLTALGALIGFRLIRAIAEPSPALVQAAVRHCILSLIVLDAAICFVTQGLGPAAVIVLLLVPATIAGKWIAST